MAFAIDERQSEYVEVAPFGIGVLVAPAKGSEDGFEYGRTCPTIMATSESQDSLAAADEPGLPFY